MSIESPCVKVCRLDPHNVCEGCGRTLDEIAQWSAASEQRQRDIVAAARLRLAVLRRSADGAPERR